jgi:hypothetical protein
LPLRRNPIPETDSHFFAAAQLVDAIAAVRVERQVERHQLGSEPLWRPLTRVSQRYETNTLADYRAAADALDL